MSFCGQFVKKETKYIRLRLNVHISMSLKNMLQKNVISPDVLDYLVLIASHNRNLF